LLPFLRALRAGTGNGVLSNQSAEIRRGVIASSPPGISAAVGDFDEVVPELRLHRAVDLAHLGREDDGVELLDHLAGGELPEVPALLAGGALGVLAGHVGELGAAFDLLLQVLALQLVFHQDVAGAGDGHGVLLASVKSWGKYIYLGPLSS